MSVSLELSSRVGFSGFPTIPVTGAGSDSRLRFFNSSAAPVSAFVPAVKMDDSTFYVAPRFSSVASSIIRRDGRFGGVFPSLPTVCWTIDEDAYFSTRKQISS